MSLKCVTKALSVSLEDTQICVWLAWIWVAQIPGLPTSGGEARGDVLPQVTSWQ